MNENSKIISIVLVSLFIVALAWVRIYSINLKEARIEAKEASYKMKAFGYLYYSDEQRFQDLIRRKK